jgi:putative ABC transport system ATP-binding protein
MPVLRTQRLCKDFGTAPNVVSAVIDIDLTIEPGEFVAIVGPSGSGKSTLLHLLGLVEVPTSGQVWIADTDTSQLDDTQLSQLRRQRIGFVFQRFNLLPTLRAIENVSLPLLLSGLSRAQAEARAANALERVEMEHRKHHYPAEMSGGEQQRVAIARAIVTNPSVILADEPTGSLDSQNTQRVIDLLHQLNAADNTIVVVTHDPRVADSARRKMYFRDGRIAATPP